MEFGFWALCGLFVLCVATRTTYELAKKAERVDASRTFLLALVFVAMFLLWTSWFVMCPRDPWAFRLPSIARWAGLGVVVAGWGLAIGALVQLRGVENIDHLVTTGLFARIRHPMYMGFVFWILGWAVYNGAALCLIVGVLAIGNIAYWSLLEDAALEATYGEQYRDYRQGTWF